MAAHARIAPSSLALTVACNASVQLQELVPVMPETEDEAEGTAAHIVAMMHAAGLGATWVVGYKFASNGRTWTVDVDMWTGARMYAAALGGHHAHLRLEDAVRASRIHPEHCYGTPDAWRYYPEGYGGPRNVPVLMCADYKYGHRFVEVFENYQILAYLVGVMERLNLDDQNLILEFVLVQPCNYNVEGPVRRWKVRASDMRALINIASNAAHAALAANPTATTGSHCVDCKARGQCKTLHYAGTQIVQYAGSAELQNMSAEAMGQELRILHDAMKQLEARKTGLAAHVEAVLRAGTQVPMWKMEPQRANLKWMDNVTIEDVGVMGDLMGVELRKPAALITPTQAKDAGIEEAIVLQYASRLPGALALKPDSSIAAKKVFAHHGK